MPFASSVFLVLFLPVVLLVHAVAPLRLRGAFLLAASVFFYAWGAPRFVFVVVATTLADFYIVRTMARSLRPATRRAWLGLSIGVNLALLIGCKYGGFLTENAAGLSRLAGLSWAPSWPTIVLPLGISFYTFETITYVVDVYRGIHPPLASPWLYQLYIFLFPKMLAGPIVRYREIATQLPAPPGRVAADAWISGFFRMTLGLGKKVLLANPLSEVVDWVYGSRAADWAGLNPAALTAGTAWIAAVSFAFQIYFDFSGYSDMAIGMGRMLGLRLPENFDNPFTSASLTEFWRRWHITLGGFMREYLYIPLGGNRADSRLGPSLVLMIVFLASGLWHGASWNFVIWGALHGLGVLAERRLPFLFDLIPRPVRIAGTFVFFVITMVFFRIPELPRALAQIAGLFGAGTGASSYIPAEERLVAFGLALFFGWFVLYPGGRSLAKRVYAERPEARDLLPFSILGAALFVLCLAHLTGRGFRPFVYFRF